MQITIIGAGKSGLSAAKLAKDLGHDVFVSESNQAEQYKDAANELKKLGIPYEFGGNTMRSLECDEIIASPGVPPNSEIILSAENNRIKIISELEFARLHCPQNPLIAITGTNGKTTTTTLTTYLLNQAGIKALSAGNIGTPLSELVNNIDKETVIVAETSSYQLDRIDKFRPDIAMILNITPDHLAYHGSFESYVESKCKIFSNMLSENLLILNADDNVVVKSTEKFRGQKAFFSINTLRATVGTGIYRKEGGIYFSHSNKQYKEEYLMLIDEIRLPGIHNAYNSMAAALAARAFEIRNENIRDSLMRFQGVEHRLEPVRIIKDIEFVNDSKATNINAAWFALSSYNENIIWIAGGRADNNNYSELDELVEKNVKVIIAIGEEKDNIFNHFCSKKRCYKFDSLTESVSNALSLAQSGDVVLFSPACKSFDMFMNYEHRGEVFKELVHSL